MCAKLIFIKPDSSDEEIIKKTLMDETFGKSYFFKGSGKYEKTLFYVTHGDKKGFSVISPHSKDKSYSQKEFAFYICGLIESSKYRNSVENIITTECYGGCHHPTKLNICGREVIMRSISNLKTQLWAGWCKRNNDFIFDAFIASEDEFTKIAIKFGRITPQLSLRKNDANCLNDEYVYAMTQKFVQEVVNITLKQLPEQFDLIEKEIDLNEILAQ